MEYSISVMTLRKLYYDTGACMEIGRAFQLNRIVQSEDILNNVVFCGLMRSDGSSQI